VAFPWLLYPMVEREGLLAVLAPGVLWAAAWPVLAGGVLAVGLWHWGDRLPRVPEGDVVVAGEAAMRGAAAWSEALERADGLLRQWPMAGLSLLTLAIVLGVAMLAWG